MAVTLNIGGVDKSASVDWTSVVKTEVLTKEPDTLTFRIKNYDTKTYRPALGAEVTLYDGATKVFGGLVITTKETIDGNLRYFEVKCTKDFSHSLDRNLVANTYENMTAAAIIADLIDNYTDPADGFTYTNVVAPDTIDIIVFNYLTISECLKKIAAMIGTYDWYVDYDKDIHFFAHTSVAAPFNLSDTSDNYLWNSLEVEQDLSQLRNHIIVRGGDEIGDSVTNEQVADGAQRVFFIGYDLTISTLVVQTSPAADPGTFTTLSVGSDGVDNATSFDCLYNPNKGLIIFRDNNKPAVGDHVKTSGTPTFPLVAERIDPASTSLYGVYQYLIVDKTIKSRDAARQRADGELQRYSTPANFARFSTYTAGLRTGQTITINSAIRNISQDYTIERVTTRLRTPDSFIYDVECLASEDVTMVDVLNRLLITDPATQLTTQQNEIIDVLASVIETLGITEAVAISLSHNPQTEAMTLTEALYPQAVDYDTRFVFGPYVPTISIGGADTKRQFLFDGSPLDPRYPIYLILMETGDRLLLEDGGFIVYTNDVA